MSQRKFAETILPGVRRRDIEYAMTLEQIGKIEGISPQRVQEIIARAMRKIRRNAGPLLFRMREASLYLEEERSKRSGNGAIYGKGDTRGQTRKQ